MSPDALGLLLRQVRDGQVAPEDAERRLKAVPLGGGDSEVGDFAKVDLGRRDRCGSPEVIFGQGKTPEQIAGILARLRDHGHAGLATRVAPEAGEALVAAFPEGQWNRTARTFRVPPKDDPGPKVGRVVVVTAGTSDLPVAEEARVTAEAWNCEVTLLSDVGVAGLHRLLSRLDALRGADCLVVCAGMEGALPSVVGGLADCPVIAVPTSIGYGASLGGVAALLGMLNSCSSNVVVVNIDSGFNGGHVAGLIARRAGLARAGAGKADSGSPGSQIPDSRTPESR